LVLTFDDVKRALPVKDCIAAVERAFQKFAEERAAVAPTRIWHQFTPESAYIYAIAAAIPDEDIMVLKTLSINWDNTKKLQIPHQYGIIYLAKNSTGVPLCVMDGNLITSIRTGAVAGLGARYLAGKNSETVAVLGSRDLGRYALLAVSQVVPSIKYVRVFSPTKKNRDLFAEEMRAEVNADIVPVEGVDQAVEDADIIITATAAHEPILFKRHIRKRGLLVDCIGSRWEVDAEVLTKVDRIVAECEECASYGKFGLAIEKGLLKESELHAYLKDLISGKKTGRMSDKDVIFFDTIGIALEDSIPAWIAYSNAKKMGLGTEVDMYGGLRAWG
jgi:ornithine cyclodeaminase/alanine dehydrogenase-like protein (mu-crystallin family)